MEKPEERDLSDREKAPMDGKPKEETVSSFKKLLESEILTELRINDDFDGAQALKDEITQKIKSEIGQELTKRVESLKEEVLAAISAQKDKYLRAEAKDKEKEESYVRLSLNLRLQHMMLISSVFVLILTGLPLKFSELSISSSIIWAMGGISGSTTIHRVAAAVLIFVAFYHFCFIILTREGRYNFAKLFPSPQDLRDAFKMIFYFCGLGHEKPKFDRFSYIEKFDYWAVYWGSIIMIGSGSMMWFQDLTMKFLPKFFLDIAKEAHSDEALLATLAIIIWHLYNVHFNPERFPGSLTWWHGRITRQELIEHHTLEYERITASKAQAKHAPAQIGPD